VSSYGLIQPAIYFVFLSGIQTGGRTSRIGDQDFPSNEVGTSGTTYFESYAEHQEEHTFYWLGFEHS
jgi:hypothetical protein